MQHLPLTGIRVLEFGGYISAPYASSMLCALGADVIKIEKTEAGEDFRRGVDNRSPYFIQYNAGKRSFAVDLKSPEGLEIVKALLPRTDVVLENMRPGKLAALGLGEEECRGKRPDIVFASASGFGDGGALRSRPAYDTIGQAFGGLYTVLGEAGRPALTGSCLADLITGVTAVTGVLAALVGRAATGSGQRVETSLMEAVSTLTIDAMTQYFDNGHDDPYNGSRHPQAQNFCLKTAAGSDIALHLSSSQKFWLALLEAMDRADLTDDPRFTTYNLRMKHYAELVEIVEAEFGTKTSVEWEKRLTEADVPFAPVLTMSEFIEHPQTQWLDLVEPEREGLSLLRPPWRFDGTRPARTGRAPRVGEHTRELASEVYDQEQVDALLDSGVLFAHT
ncbi:CaiB/BaiF CoA transferase family protein [Streptomyces sp. NPDC058221]|uniref:CaiB/BaiF CoA transferase family protein n=1 Tax=Streptomyces sp. NPDC058221 TaxID=3346388 RepID=UPI0036EDDC7D